jgi:hypothetical protein
MLPTADLVAEPLPEARLGLLRAGVAAAEADRLVGVIGARAWPPGRPGAAWQRAALAAAGPGRSPEQALAAMLHRYVRCAATGQPVHSWPVAS